jgi:L-amino acid N-acyltransferase YncA
MLIRNNPEIYKWFKNPSPIKDQQHKLWIKERCEKYASSTKVVVNKSTVIGIAYLSNFQRNAAYISISILPNMQNLKIGSLLLQKIIAAAKALGVKKLLAEIHFENTKSLKFFEKNGFKKSKLIIKKPNTTFIRYELKINK